MNTAVQDIRKQVAAALDKADANPYISMSDAVATAVTPAILHATNNEPWYQSRVTWGAIVSIATGVLSALGVATDWIDPDQAIALGLGVGSVVGGAITLYGRWKARKPIELA